MCENSDVETFRAIIESGRWHRRIIIAVEASFLIQYFVSASGKSFSHSLDPEPTSGMAIELLLPSRRTLESAMSRLTAVSAS